MGAELYREEPAFRDAVDRCCASPALRDAPEIAASFRGDLGDRRLSRLDQQSTLSVLKLAQIELWRAHGVTPGAVFGVSGGEMTAAYAAGMVDLDGILRVLRTSSRFVFLGKPEPHVLFGIEASSEEAKLIARRAPCDMIFVGSVTSRSSMVIVPTEEESAGRQYLRDTTVIEKEMASDARYHAPRDPIEEERHTRELSDVATRAPGVPCYLASAGRRAVTEPPDGRFWTRLLARPFYVDEAVAAAVADGWRQILALGPTDRLKPWMQATYDAHGARMEFVSSMREGESDLRAWRAARRAIRWRGPLHRLTAPAP
jgi:acyl transferase domain-containing protein